MKKKFIVMVMLLAIFLPGMGLAAELVPCSTGDDCTFESLILLINNVLKFIFTKLAVPIAAIMFVYAGFLLVTAQGGEAKGKAKTIFTNTVLGLVLAAGAYLIVKLVLVTLGYYYGGDFGF